MGEASTTVSVDSQNISNRDSTNDDRKIPGTKANIDLLVIANSAVWIVDAKNYSGKVEFRTTGLRNPVTTLVSCARGIPWWITRE